MQNQRVPAGGAGLLGFLSRLRRDTRGNAMMIMAAMLIPLAAFSGSAIDMGRLYAVKSRLQQACDAGVLAGRRSMDANNNLDTSNTGQAQTFFKNNFSTGWFNTSNVVFTPSPTSDNQVQGVAVATVPMTIMKMFGIASKAITVNCQARYDVADTDIMFVLDTTGSMACLPADSDSDCNSYVNAKLSGGGIAATEYQRPADSNLGASSGSTGSANSSTAGYPNSTGFYVPEKSGSRIAALRSAVTSFYNTLASSADPSTHIRYGFVTYTSTVNAGKAIMQMSPRYMVGGSGNSTSNWTYQSRKVISDYKYPNPDQKTYTNLNRATCDTYKVARNPLPALTYDHSTQTATETTAEYTAGNGGSCQVTKWVYGPHFKYDALSWPVSSYVSSSSVADPTKVDGSSSSWQGCVEEAYSDPPGASSFDINALPNDLNPDLVPSGSDVMTSWKPMWSDVEYGRWFNSKTASFTDQIPVEDDLEPGDGEAQFGYTSSNYVVNKKSIAKGFMQAGFVVCGKPVRRLSVMTLQDVTNYVNATDFRPIGGTYHDTGMIWGVRMLSRNGIFASDNQAWAGRQPPNRVIVFLTDGDMSPSQVSYGMYGIEYFDRRVTNGTFSNQKDYHNARFLAECAKAKAMNINIWTVSIDTSASSEMTQCATTAAQALYTTDGNDLATKFATIARQVAMLRISQ